jgi:hypothetical protein
VGAAGRLIVEPRRTIEVACFMRISLLTNTDRLLLMVRRRVADLWRRASKDANRVLIHWADLYRELLASVGALAGDTTVADSDVRERLRSLVAEHQQRKPPTRAQLVRDHLTLEIRSVRSLLSALMILPWEATPGHPVLAAIQLLRALYEHNARELPTTTAIDLGRAWRALLSGADREQAFRAFEVATLLTLRRALRNGTVWIDHSLAFRSRERLFIPPQRWEKERNAYYQRLIYTGRVANYQAKSEDEMQAVADALSLLANIVMAWNTTKMQSIFDRWAQRRSGAIPPELIARIAPTRTEGINMRGVFRFPIEQYADQLLPSRVPPKIHVLGQ